MSKNSLQMYKFGYIYYLLVQYFFPGIISYWSCLKFHLLEAECRLLFLIWLDLRSFNGTKPNPYGLLDNMQVLGGAYHTPPQKKYIWGTDCQISATIGEYALYYMHEISIKALKCEILTVDRLKCVKSFFFLTEDEKSRPDILFVIPIQYGEYDFNIRMA